MFRIRRRFLARFPGTSSLSESQLRSVLIIEFPYLNTVPGATRMAFDETIRGFSRFYILFQGDGHLPLFAATSHIASNVITVSTAR